MPKQSFDPDQEVRNYCDHIMHANIQVRKQNKQKAWYWDFPAVAVVCHDQHRMLKRCSYSHYPTNISWHPLLEVSLKRLGRIGTHLIGTCAEQHAANIYMKNVPENNIGNLYFSKAFRPRTKEQIAYCDNCKLIFPNLP